jgi:hypothetical protein
MPPAPGVRNFLTQEMPHSEYARTTIGDSMGLEAECTVRVGRKASSGTAHLEGESLIFRGEIRLEIPFERIREVAVDGDTLVVTTDEVARFELGAQVAERWMKLIKQPKELFEKLEIDSQSRVAVVDVSDALFVAALRERAASVADGRVPQGAVMILFGAEAREALRKVPLLRARMVDTGALWIVRPKASKAISEVEVLGAGRDAGLVDTKVVAFSRTHTAHKFVVPLEMRGQIRRRPPIMTIPPSTPDLSPKGPSSKTAAEKSAPRASAHPPSRKKTRSPSKKG